MGRSRRKPKKLILAPGTMTDLNEMLKDIDDKVLALDPLEFKTHYSIFHIIFNRLHKSMSKVDPYYQQYSGRVQCAGSHSDKLRIKKPVEFDLDINIGLPVCIDVNTQEPGDSDINIEPADKAYVRLRMGKQFLNLPKRDRWDINKTAYDWMDDEDYLLHSNFMNWFKGVVDKALELHKRKKEKALPVFYVNNVGYATTRSTGGPAATLNITNSRLGFYMSVDIVPCLKFPESRWPISRDFRKISTQLESKQGMWMVVPKGDRYADTDEEEFRTWRLNMHDQERGLMYHQYQLKPTIRLMKKLRDAMNLTKVSSYAVKTLFFWELAKRPSDFWMQNSAKLFVVMVELLRDALVEGDLPYFWNPSNNLIEHVEDEHLENSAARLTKLLTVLNDPTKVKMVPKYLLTRKELRDFELEFLND